VFKWLKKQGGLTAMEERNRAKAEKLYGFIEAAASTRARWRKNARSWMNVPFTLAKPELDKAFCAEAAKAGLVNSKGIVRWAACARPSTTPCHRRHRRPRELHEGIRETQRLTKSVPENGDIPIFRSQANAASPKAITTSVHNHPGNKVRDEEKDDAIQDPDSQQHQHQGARAPAARAL
jgi:hypothetical protein